ncbi:MAG: 6-bladed beta-propeller [Gammaproteobacteria bacterium]|nr:6-bladed beta-propeller [Gammaproteobacteria bacterium]
MRRTLPYITATLLPLLVTGCAVRDVAPVQAAAGSIWPDPPDAPRIEYVGEYRRAADFGIRPGFWDRLTDLIAGASDDGMVRPMDVAATEDGSIIFIADPDAGCVHRYDRRRGRYDCLVPGKNQVLVSPVSLAIAADGRLYVSDSQLGRIFTAGVDGNRLEAFETGPALQQPTGLAWDETSRRLFVADTGSQSIKVFAADGTLLREFGRRGAGPGELNYATYLWVDGRGQLLVTDSLNFRIQRFEFDGSFVQLFGKHGDIPGHLARPKGVASDGFGHVYVIDGLHSALQIFSPGGELLLSIGERGQAAGQFWLPNGLFVSRDNVIYVADSYNKRIQVFRYIGADS